ncbi:MAG: hypothetical protein QOC60_1481, partial [Frankiaceae bacterium]|nr:hypothetical protein [Frankiaceae bacterium]
MSTVSQRPAPAPRTGHVDPRRVRTMHGAVALIVATLALIVATSGRPA